MIPSLCGPFAWFLGRKDLKAMEAGMMDPSGRSPTRSGVICGIVGCCIGLAYAALLAYGFFIDPSFFEIEP
jgi:hypothetical protein